MLHTSFLSLFLLLTLGQARFYESHENPGEGDPDRLSGLTKKLPIPAEEGDPIDFEVHASSAESLESRENSGPLNVANEEAKAQKRRGNVKSHVRTGAVPKVINGKKGDVLEKAIKISKAKAAKARSSRRGIDPDQAIEEEFAPLQTRVRGGVKGARSSGRANPQADKRGNTPVKEEKTASNGAEKASTRAGADDTAGKDDASTKTPKEKKPDVNGDRVAKGSKLVERSSAYPAEKRFVVTAAKKGDVEGGDHK